MQNRGHNERVDRKEPRETSMRDNDPALVLFFGDQGIKSADALRRILIHARNSPALERFVQRTTGTLQNEISRLRPADRKRFGNFSSLHDLADAYAGAEVPDAACAAVLLCIVQLACLIL